MKNIVELNKELRQYGKKDSKLLFFCIFLSQCLMTAYMVIMYSPTVLKILPVGGDSRKQVMGIFIFTCIGCIVFVCYAAMLFFKQRSRQSGILMALGINRKTLLGQILSEILSISLRACGIGIVTGIVIATAIWQAFQSFIVDTQEMRFSFDIKSLYAALIFAFVINLILVVQALRFQRQTNIMDVLNTVRKNEPIHEVKKWFGWGGIFLILLGFFLGYFSPAFCVHVLSWYPPEGLTAIFYSPLFIGIYMVTYYTVVHGWTRDKNRYKNIITKSMMKFQGKQTIMNMLIILVLVAGGLFAAFYAPMIGTSSLCYISSREVDYLFHYRQDQEMLSRDDIDRLGKKYELTIEDYKTIEFANLALDGEQLIEEQNGKYHMQYREILGEGNFISESNFEAFTGMQVEIDKGYYMGINTVDQEKVIDISSDITKLTNPETNEQVEVQYGGNVINNSLAANYYIISDIDYRVLTSNLSNEWKEMLVAFNVSDNQDKYHFDKELYWEIIKHSDSDCEVPYSFDRISKRESEQRGEAYWGDDEKEKIHYEDYESSEFRQFWKYQPMIKSLDRRELLQTYAVFFMVFIFITIICFTAVLIIIYTRNITLAMHNKQVYEDLKKLGAGRDYLYKCVKSQVGQIFKAPIMIGMSIISLLYSLILYLNDEGHFTNGELMGMMVCLVMEIMLCIGFFLFYKYNLSRVCMLLDIDWTKEKTE